MHIKLRSQSLIFSNLAKVSLVLLTAISLQLFSIGDARATSHCPSDPQEIRDFSAAIVLAGEPTDRIHIAHLKSAFKKYSSLALRLATTLPDELSLCMEETFGSAGFQDSLLSPNLILENANLFQEIAAYVNNWDSLPDFLCESFSQMTETAISKIKIGTLPAVQDLLDPVGGIDLSDAPAFLRQYFEAIVTRYFDEIPSAMRREAISAYLKVSPSASKTEKLHAVLNHAGPALQKLFQLISKKSKSESMKETLDQLRSGIDPMSRSEVKSVIAETFGSDEALGEILSTFRIKPIAAATIGQVHFATLRPTQGKKAKKENPAIVMKIQRRNLEQKVKAELEVLSNIAPNEQARSMLNHIRPLLAEELDFTQEARSLDRGVEVYENPEEHLFVVHRPKSIPMLKNVLAMQRAPGKAFDHIEWDNTTSCAKASTLSALHKKWLRETLFGSGFFHGDLHGGNMFLNVNRAAPEKSDITLIDFGNSFTLNQSQQAGLIQYIIGIRARSAHLILTGLLGSEGMSKLSHEHLRKFTDHLNDLNDQSTSDLKMSQEVIDMIANFGIEVPREFLAFERGDSFLEYQLIEAIQHVGSHPCKGIRSPEDNFKDVIFEGFQINSGKAFLRSLFSRSNSVGLNRHVRFEILKELFLSKAKDRLHYLKTTMDELDEFSLIY